MFTVYWINNVYYYKGKGTCLPAQFQSIVLVYIALHKGPVFFCSNTETIWENNMMYNII